MANAESPDSNYSRQPVISNHIHANQHAQPKIAITSACDTSCHIAVLLSPEMKWRCTMEPMVLLGLIAVAYGGYVAWFDLRKDVSALFPLRAARRDGRIKAGKRRLQSPIKKMAGMYV